MPHGPALDWFKIFVIVESSPSSACLQRLCTFWKKTEKVPLYGFVATVLISPIVIHIMFIAIAIQFSSDLSSYSFGQFHCNTVLLNIILIKHVKYNFHTVCWISPSYCLLNITFILFVECHLHAVCWTSTPYCLLNITFMQLVSVSQSHNLLLVFVPAHWYTFLQTFHHESLAHFPPSTTHFIHQSSPTL